MTTQPPQLKTCPFCGGETWHGFYSGSPTIACTACPAAMGGEESMASRDELTIAWNQRAAPTVAAPPPQTLENALDEYWDAAWHEGHDGRLHDTKDGRAQQARVNVYKAIAADRAARAATPAPHPLDELTRINEELGLYELEAATLPIYADLLTQAIQRLNSNPYNLTKDECIQVIRELRDKSAAPQAVEQASQASEGKLWLWKNFIDGKPEYLAFDNPFPVFMHHGDPQTLGEPCGYAIFRPSRVGRMDVSEADVIRRIKASNAEAPSGGQASPIVAWDVYEHRIFGSPDEVAHRVLWVDNYRREDGSTPDLDWLLEAARGGGIDRASKTIHVRPLAYAEAPKGDPGLHTPPPHVLEALKEDLGLAGYTDAEIAEAQAEIAALNRVPKGERPALSQRERLTESELTALFNVANSQLATATRPHEMFAMLARIVETDLAAKWGIGLEGGE